MIRDRAPAAERARMGWLVRAALTGAVVGALFLVVDVHAALAALRSARPEPLLAAMALFLTACAVSSATWLFLLVTLGHRVGFLNAFRLNLIGFFFNNFVPAGVGGDIWRAWTYARQAAHGEGGTAGAPPAGLGASAASVLAERWVALMGVVLLAWAILPLCPTRLGGVELQLGGARRLPAPLAVLLMTGALTVGVAAVLIGFRPTVSRLRGWFVARWGATSQVDAFLGSLLVYRRGPARLAAATLFSALSPFVESFAYMMLAFALGLDIGPIPFIVLTPVLRITHHFPLTMNGAGVQDAAMVWIMAALGVSPAQGLALSLLVHGTKIVVGVLSLPLLAQMTWSERRRRNSAAPV